MKLDYQVLVQTVDGPHVVKGTKEYTGGAAQLHCQVPEGHFQSVRAFIPLTVLSDEKIFMNGYQTWTYCPEYPKNGRIRGVQGFPGPLVRHFGLDRYGDYHFVTYPNRPGITHGFSYCYFRRGEKYRLFASLNEQPGYTMFRYDANIGVLILERDCSGVKCGGEYPLFDLFYAEGDEKTVFDGWFRALGCVPRTDRKIAGYTSWYNRYQNITQQTIRSDLDGCRTLLRQGDLFQIDDGWESFVGDWLEADHEKFPGGMKALADEIHESGFLAGLWLAPFVCQEGSALLREHPEWLLKVEGKPWRLGSNWGGFYALNFDHPGVRDYLRRVFDRVLTQWGYDLVKLDFLYGAAPFGTEDETRAGRMIRAMDFLRELCGDKLILGCGVPVMPAFGKVDYCRVSCDVGLDWDDKWFMRHVNRERVSTAHAVENSVFRRQLNGRAYLSDPDVFYLRSENLNLTPGQKDLLAKVNAVVGGVFLTSDDPGTYSPEQKAEYDRLRRLCDAENIRVDADSGLKLRYTLDGRESELILR